MLRLSVVSVSHHRVVVFIMSITMIVGFVIQGGSLITYHVRIPCFVYYIK